MRSEATSVNRRDTLQTRGESLPRVVARKTSGQFRIACENLDRVGNYEYEIDTGSDCQIRYYYHDMPTDRMAFIPTNPPYAMASFGSFTTGTAIAVGEPFELDEVHVISINGPQVAADLYLRKQLSAYFESKGPKQRELRAVIAKTLRQSADVQSGISAILAHIAEPAPQAHIFAAIDLLVQLGNRVLLVALDDAFSAVPRSDNAAYALAMAAGKISPSFINLGLLVSRHEAYREAAVTLLSALPLEQARPALRKIAADDPSPEIRALAADALRALS
jgi:hypothetical protein